MRSGRIRAAAAVLVMAVLAATYTTRLGEVPMQLMQDEVNFSLQAYALATTGRDTNGRRLPVYFSETGFEAGRDPIMIYVTAAALGWRPLSDSAVRMPTALVGILSVGLMFGLCRSVFGTAGMGVLGGVLLALTPAFFVNSRLALSIIYPVPFILAWLWALVRVERDGSRWALVLAAAALGLGVYSYLASLVMMPIYLVLTDRLLAGRRRGFRERGMAWAVFGAMLLPLVAWQILHPGRYAELVQAYRPYDPQGSGLIGSVLTSLHAGEWRQRVSAFWMFFNPDYLFISGDSRMTNSTRTAGLFPLAFAALIPIGAYAIARTRHAWWRIVLLGLLTAPLATALSGRLDINRVLCGVPFGALIATRGVACLWERRRWLPRAAAVALVLAVTIQFVRFHADYLGRYRFDSAPYFGRDERGAVQTVLDATDARTTIFLNRATVIERYWRFYAYAGGRGDLVDAPIYYDPAHFAAPETGGRALIVCDSGVPLCETLRTSARWTRLRALYEPHGAPTLEVYLAP